MKRLREAIALYRIYRQCHKPIAATRTLPLRPLLVLARRPEHRAQAARQDHPKQPPIEGGVMHPMLRESCDEAMACAQIENDQTNLS